jgi:hypothetical protein
MSSLIFSSSYFYGNQKHIPRLCKMNKALDFFVHLYKNTSLKKATKNKNNSLPTQRWAVFFLCRGVERCEKKGWQASGRGVVGEEGSGAPAMHPIHSIWPHPGVIATHAASASASGVTELCMIGPSRVLSLEHHGHYVD